MNNENPNIPVLEPVPNTETPKPVNPVEPQVVNPVSTPEIVVPKGFEEQASPAPATTPAPIEPAPMTNPVAARPVVSPTVSNQETRYNPVTGEEMNMSDVKPQAVPTTLGEGAVNNEEKLKTVDVNYKPTSTGNTVMLVIFFIVLIAFVIFLPDIQTLIAQYKAGPVEVEEITSGKLVCTLSSNTVNLDRDITRVFEYSDNKLVSAKFTTIVRGDPSLDEETLDELNAQCEQIKTNVQELEGASVSCSYEDGKLTEQETFDFGTYKIEEVSAAYTEAGGTVIEFQAGEEIDSVMTNMRQGGFVCNKEK